ncbi:3-oxoacyl-ACP synthase [Geojedonia litorea]|uniref:3-oxoacyl-ACP synthase n=1 Tax=Geojedonia litorea TaxID=1268269 RepID=A0ABV9N7A9_9FLAO
MVNNIKTSLLKLCFQKVEERQINLQKVFDELQEALQNETKSSAGDKHETTRAMLQLEREKLGQQLAEVDNLASTLSKIDVNRVTTQVAFGSVVFTSSTNYFIAVSLGQLNTHKQDFFAISSTTPIGQQLLGKGVGDHIEFRDQVFKITKII